MAFYIERFFSGLALVILLLLMQILYWNGLRFPGDSEEKAFFWAGSRSIKPELGIVPNVPSDAVVKAFAFGDSQFYFRINALQIQNAGDTYGRYTSLLKYDYSELYKWWIILDNIDSTSNLIASMVSYYYGATKGYKTQIPYVSNFLEQHADHDPEKKWWWYGQAIYHANTKEKNLDKALRIAQKMANVPVSAKMPLWGRQMEAFMLEKKGEYAKACDIIINILDTYKDIPKGEINFMMYFIDERIYAMSKSPDQSDINPRCKALYNKVNKKNR